MRVHLFVLLGFLVFPKAVWAAEGDWFASLYTLEGIELRADERVFTLYALLNAMGYDRAPALRSQPIPKFKFHSVRQQVREKLQSLPVETRKKADAFFDAHPAPLSHYLAYALNSSPPPFATGAKNRDLADLKGLEGVLKEVYVSARLGEVLASVQPEYRKALKAYLTGLDAPIVRARKLLRLSDKDASATLVMNLLDADGTVFGVQGDGEVVLVVGPSEGSANTEGAVREFARVWLEPKVNKKAQSNWGGGSALLREAQLLGAQETTVGDYATSLLSRAVALSVTDAPDAAWDKAAQEGYFGLREIARAFNESGAVENWLLDALARAETRRPARK